MADMESSSSSEGSETEEQSGSGGNSSSSVQFNECSADDLFRVLQPLESPTLLCWRSHRKDNLAMWEKKGRPTRSLVTQRLYGELFPHTIPSPMRYELARIVDAKDIMGMIKKCTFNPDSPSSSLGLEFTLDGRLVLSCHDDGVIRGLDSRTHGIQHQYMAHDDSCNGATMIDNNTFASYSDDMTIKVWDLRNTSRRVKLVSGHTGWVNNVSVVPGSRRLLSSGFDSYIRISDITDPEQEIQSTKVMTFPQLLRTQLSPNGDFLVLTTRKSHVYVIKNLDLEKLPTEYAKYFAPPEKHRIPYPLESNLLELLHYSRGNNETHPGYSLDIRPQADCCIVRHHPVQTNYSGTNIFGVRKSDFVSVYDIKTTKYTKVASLRNQYLHNPGTFMKKKVDCDFRSTKGPNPLRNYEYIDERNTRQEDHSCLLWRVNYLLLAGSIDPRERMGEIVKFSNDPPVDLNYAMNMGFGLPTTSNTSAFVEDAQFYAIVKRPQHNQIIREISFDSTGKLMAVPAQNGFQVFGFSSELDDYKYAFSHKKTFFGNCPKLNELVWFPLHFSAYSVKFSPTENDKIVASGTDGTLKWHYAERPDIV